MFGFFKKKADVLDHWIAFVEGFELVPSEFYVAIEKQITELDLPGLQISRIDFTEGAILSAKRVYLRILRERLVFDVCAAPFGRTFFFSCRSAEIPAVVHLAYIIGLICLFGFLVLLSFFAFGKIFGVLAVVVWPAAWIVFPILAIYVMRNPVAIGLKDLDNTLMQIPLLGPVYEAWIRKETYFRHDTRLMYLEIVSRVVKNLAEDAVAQKGLKLLRQYEQKPILGEIYKPVSPSQAESSPRG
jgi:hypothetical protein